MKPRSKRIRDNAERGVYAHGIAIKEARTLEEALKDGCLAQFLFLSDEAIYFLNSTLKNQFLTPFISTDFRMFFLHLTR